MRIGLITDTHQPSELKHLWPEVHHAFEGIDLILHGGDIVHPMVLDWLEEIAPTLACRGNNDIGWDDRRMTDTVILELEGLRIAMRHDMEPESRPIETLLHRYWKGERHDILIAGDTHFELIDYRDGVLQVNSGSPTLPHHWSTRLGTVGLLEIAGGAILEAKIVRLGETEGRKNPGIEFHYAPETGVRRLG
jgi:putative phosphoesterase